GDSPDGRPLECYSYVYSVYHHTSLLFQGRSVALLCRYDRMLVFSAVVNPHHISRQGDPGDGPGRRGRDAYGHSGAADIPHYVRRWLSAGRPGGLHYDATLFRVPHRRT